MCRLMLLACSILSWSAGISQQREIDSTFNELRKRPRPDTVRWLLLNDVAYYYQFIDPAKGVVYADTALELAKQLKRPTAIAGSYSSKGMNYHAMGKDSLALAMYHQALKIHEQSNNILGIAKAYNNLAIIYVDISDYAGALIYHEKALEVFRQLKDELRMAGSYNNMGVVYMYIADMPKAMDCYLHALAIYEKKGDKINIGNAYTNIGIIKKNLKDYQESIAWHKKAQAVFERSGNQNLLANVIGNIGVTYDAAGDTLLAIKYYKDAIQLCKKVGNQHGIANNLTNIAILYKSGKNYYSSLEYFNNAIAIYTRLDDKNGMSIALSQLGSLYSEVPDNFLLKTGFLPADRFTKVLGYYTKSLQLAKDIDAPDRQAEILQHLSELYEQKRDFKNALQTYRSFVMLNDSILSDEKIKEITRKEVQFEAGKKEALLNAGYTAAFAQQKTQRNEIIAGTVLISLGGLISFLFYKRKTDAVTREKEAEMKAEISDIEMKALRAQMNPHFIFNSLNSISDYIAKNNSKLADEYLTKFARLMRLILENSEQKEVALYKDLNALDLYIQLEAVRLNHKFTYEIKVDDSINPDTVLIPPLILQPFVENSIWHGIAKKQGPGKISVSIKREGDMMNCVVEDDGIGRKPIEMTGDIQQQEDGKSLGMKITGQRIEMMNKLKNSSATIRLSDLQPGMRVEVKLPLQLIF